MRQMRAIKRFLKEMIGKKYPKTYTIETVLGCNLQCPECALGGGAITREKGCMSFERFKIIADKIRPYAEYLYLHMWGEPLLNKDIFKIIEYASHIAGTNISTNGMLVTEEIANKLVLAGTSDIIVSIDGMTQSVYEAYRKGGNVEKALAALKHIVQAKEKYHSKVRIIPQFIVFEHNQSEMEPFRRYCESLGVQAEFKAPYIRVGEKFKNSSLKEYIRKPFHDRQKFEKAILNCNAFVDVFTIDINGNVILCCYDANSKIIFGNIFEQTVHEIYYGEKHQKFLENVKQKKQCPDFCKKNCLFYLMASNEE